MVNGKIMAWMLAGTLLLGANATVLGQQEAEQGLRLSLADCLGTALENNLDLVSARKDPLIAEEQVAVNQAAFDGVIGANANLTDSSSDKLITDLSPAMLGAVPGASDDETNSGGVSWSQLLNYGANYSLSVNLRDEAATSSDISLFTGQLSATDRDTTAESISLRYEMPLLQGFGRETNKVNVLLARSGVSTSKEDLRLQAMRTMQQVEDAYWDLLATRAALQVARESLKLARDLYELNKKKVEVGTLAPIDVTQAEAGVASREEDVIVAENAVQNAEDVLRGLLAFPSDDPSWRMPIIPTDSADFEPRDVDVEAALATALERRPEIINARQQVRDRELSQRVAKNGVRHSLDLTAEITRNQGDTDFSFSESGLLVSFTNQDSDGDDWSVQLVYGYPIRNRRAKAEYAVSTLNREKSEVALRNAEQDIRIDVRTAARNVVSGVKRVGAARSNTVLQRKTLEAEQKKYENGMSTSFEVLRIQTDLSDARLAEIRAILDYMKGLADLERAKGTLLEARGLTLAP